MAISIQRVAAEMARAVELTMDPSIPQQQRLQAYAACEQFKETSPLCAQCGFYLAQSGDMSHFVRHFGLQLIEHCVKFRWNKISQPEKLFIKENAMNLLYTGTVQEQTHIKDALSRVVVEMIKREWPQQWPNLLKELSDACKLGENQTELVLFVFLRLVEDVVLLKTLESHQRRKDIHTALTTNMSEIFIFFLRIIEEHCNSYQTKMDSGQTLEASPHLRVVHVALQTLAAFVEWVSTDNIMVAEGRLLQILCLLLERKDFQTPAAECLLHIVNRRGRVAERKPLLILFSEDALQCMLRAFNSTLEDERHYVFLKLLSQVLVGLGTQLCWLWDKENGTIGRPVHFKLYLSTILRFTEHPSLTLAHSINSIWMSFLKNDLISKDQVFLEYLPTWLQDTSQKIIKVEYPSSCSLADSKVTTYLCMDYSTEEEFTTFYHRFRRDLLDAIRQASLIAPLITFSYVEKWLTACLCRAISNPPINLNLQPVIFPEWEALSQVLDSALSCIRLFPEQPSVQTGLHLLLSCLNYQPTHPLLLSTLLSCISALFVFLSLEPNENSARLLPQVLDKIFNALVLTVPGQAADSPSVEVRNARSHAANIMVKLSRKYPQLLGPVFPRIHAAVQELSGQLLRREKVNLQEALLLISNHFCDYERQTRFVGEVVGLWANQWLLLGTEAFKGLHEFITFVGLDRSPLEPDDGDLHFQNRSDIHFCVNLFMVMVRHCSWPADLDRAATGGFYTARTAAGESVLRNPVAPHVIPLLPTLLALLRIFNALWTPEALTLISEGYRPAYTMLISDRTNPLAGELLDLTRARNKSPLECMSQFLTTVHDNCYQVLGGACTNLGHDFYGLVGLVPSLIDSVFSNLEVIPDFRLRPIVRVFFKPFVCCCPPASYESVLLPLLAHFCPYMFQRLNNKWQYVTQLCEAGGVEHENSEQQEVTEDMMTRTLTRDYLDVLKVALVASTNQQAGSMDQDEQPRFNSFLLTKVSDLGTLILGHESTCQSVALCIFRAMSWSDTIASQTATWLTAPIVRKLFNDGSLTPPMAAHVMTSVLQGLEMHGQHETNSCALLTLGVQVYEILRPKFPNVVDVMMQIPGCTAADLKKLDEKVMTHNQTANPAKVEKSKRDVFIRVTSKLVGRSVGQLFRKEVSIADLPRLEVPQRPKQPPLDEQLRDNDTLCPLFPPSRS